MKIAEKHLSHADSLNLFESLLDKSVFKSSTRPNLKNKKILFIDSNFYKYCYEYILSKLRSLILEPNPFICLIGPDGVGKSSVSEGLVEHLTKSNFFRKVKIFHHRFDYVPQLGKYKFKKNKTSLKHNMINSRVHRPLRTTIYLFYYSIDYLFGWLEILKSKFRDEIIIMDRYFYDFYIQNSYSRSIGFV